MVARLTVLGLVLLAATAAHAQIAAGNETDRDHDHGAHDHDHDHGQALAADDAPCVTDPTAPACANFTLSEEIFHDDLMALCKAMPFMPACSIHEACEEAAPSDDAFTGNWTARVGPGAAVCSPANLIATVCELDAGMGNMAGCQAHWNPMCKANGSVVAQCRENPGLAQLPTTNAANAAVKQLCTARRNRTGCDECLEAYDANRTYGSCDLLATLGAVCQAEPSVPQCAGYSALCAGRAWFFCTAEGAAGAVNRAAPANATAGGASGTAARSAAGAAAAWSAALYAALSVAAVLFAVAA